MNVPESRLRLDPSLVGELLGVSTVTVSAAATRAYALATNDENPVYLRGEVVPPLYQVTLAARAMPRETMVAKGLDVVGARIGPHAAHDMQFVSPIRPGETIVTEARVAAIEPHRLGELVHIAIHSQAASGEDRCDVTMSILFVDDAAQLRGSRETRPAGSPRPPIASARMVVTSDQPLRYAEASGDHTRTHVDEAFARSLGYPTYLLQGLCTMAFAGKAVVDELAGGDPTRLRRLKVRFSAPVFPGDILTTAMWPDDGESTFAFTTANRHGAQVIRGGLAEVAPLDDRPSTAAGT